MNKPFDTIPIELQTKSSDYINKIQEFNKELKDLKIPIQFQMTLTEHRKLDWNKEENYYWRDTVKFFNSMVVMDSNDFI
ncbi:MAG: hypothetical protein GY739_05375 [Mesoflavibacter sp.]|nr:hypothetical protein [Mesoflavibacter sp.]